MPEITLPRKLVPEGEELNPHDLAAGRYGTHEQVNIWGPDKTFEYSLKVQGESAMTLSRLHPDVISTAHAEEIFTKANLEYVSAAKIRAREARTGHDVIAINKELEDVLTPAAGAHVNKLKTSADTTEPAKALQIKAALEVIIDSVENLRDVVIEKSLEWKDIPHMDQSHGYDALPTVLGRPFAHYAETLQTDLVLLRHFYDHSIIGKWADATGNHHSATALCVDGITLQREYCAELGIGFMDAPAQVPALEFQADVVFSLARTMSTCENLARYVRWARGDDVGILINNSPHKQKGSSAMPHKDAKNGNPSDEEQVMSLARHMRGILTTSMENIQMEYARDLGASANMRICLEDGFKASDHAIRKLANRLYWMKPKEDRCKDRVLRSYGVVTSQQVMSCLTDHRQVNPPMTRSEAHDLTARLATQAWNTKTQYIDVLLSEPEITSRLNEEKLRIIADPLQYIGESKRIVDIIAEKYHKRKTLVKEEKKG